MPTVAPPATRSPTAPSTYQRTYHGLDRAAPDAARRSSRACSHVRRPCVRRKLEISASGLAGGDVDAVLAARIDG